MDKSIVGSQHAFSRRIHSYDQALQLLPTGRAYGQPKRFLHL
jgi:hypothetical protein